EKAKIFWSKLQTRNQVDYAFDLLNTYLKSLKEGIKDQSATNQEYVRAMNIMLEVGMRNCFIKEHDTFEEIIISAETAVAEEQSDLWISKEDLDCENVTDDTSLDDQSKLQTRNQVDYAFDLLNTYLKSLKEGIKDQSATNQGAGKKHLNKLKIFFKNFNKVPYNTLWCAGILYDILYRFEYMPAGVGCRGYIPTLFEKRPGIFNDHRESGPRFYVSSEGRRLFSQEVSHPGTDQAHTAELQRGASCELQSDMATGVFVEWNGACNPYRVSRADRIYECGPWCACDRRRCLNRVVQHGLRVKLQVFRTQDRGWGVRCLHDLDQGTFVCTYAGKILRKDPAPGSVPEATRGNGQEEERRDAPQSSGKRKRGEPPSDDDVEVVEERREEQRAAEDPSLLGRLNEKGAPCAKLSPQNPAIRRPVSKTALLHVQLDKMMKENSFTIPYSSSDEEDLRELSKERVRIPASAETTDRLRARALAEQAAEALDVPNRVEGGALRGGDSRTPHQAQREEEEDVNSLGTWSVGEDSNDEEMPSKTRAAQKMEKGQKNTHEFTYYLDATEEGNVGRFLNHSCCPNLFVQSVFTDSHNKNFPCVAFFTNGYVKAGTELTWNYTCRTGSTPNQDNPCQCELKKGQNTLA
ncbi:SETB2 methyltransferase, partial [Atractosteus spatula]|nr:SETB2 methyltransferase [Atractosteus spatula]